MTRDVEDDERSWPLLLDLHDTRGAAGIDRRAMESNSSDHETSDSGLGVTVTLSQEA